MVDCNTFYEALNQYKGKRIVFLLVGEDREYQNPTIIDLKHEYLVIKVDSLTDEKGKSSVNTHLVYINIVEAPITLFVVEE